MSEAYEDKEPTTANQDDLQVAMDDIMDVIMLYKCKFCEFSCGSPPEIRKHVQDVHVVHQVKAQNVEHTPEQMQELSMEPVELSIEEHANVHMIKGNSAEVTHDMEVESMHREIALSEANPDNMPVEISLDENNFIEEVEMSVGQQYTGDMVDCGTDVIDINNPNSQLVLETTISNDLTELYLCGQCNLGFDTIENCKSHIMKDHNATLEDDKLDFVDETKDSDDQLMEDESEISKTTFFVNGKTSTGTQAVTRKKPGRKRKVLKTEEKEKEEEIKIEDFEEDEIAVIEEHKQNVKEEEMENKEIESEGRSRRKRRLPSRLSSLYYVGKPSTIRKQPSTPSSPPVAKKIKPDPCKYYCPKKYCTAKFKTQGSLAIHTSCHKIFLDKGQEREMFGCTKCQEYTPQWKLMRLHLWREHAIDTDLYTCNSCGFKSDTFGRIERHAQIHGEARPFSCQDCGKCFKQLSQLHNHKLTHIDTTNDPDKSYANRQCDICQRIFANQKCLKNHIDIVHSKEKPFACPYCDHVTSRKAILDLHIRTHTGEKPYKCDVCTYVTGDHNSLRRHVMRHTGQRPYKCQHCSYTAIQAISLKTHMRSKHPGQEGMYTCDSCPYRTINQDLFKNHQLDHKNGLISNVRTVRRPNSNTNTYIVNTPQANSNYAVSRPQPRSVLNKSVLNALHGQMPGAQRQILMINGNPVSAIQLPSGVGSMQLGKNDSGETVFGNKVPHFGGLEQVGSTRVIYTPIMPAPLGNEKTGIEVTQVQPEVRVIEEPSEAGAATHTITFHLPTQEGKPNVSIDETMIQVDNLPSQNVPEGNSSVVSTADGSAVEEGTVIYAVQTGEGDQSQQEMVEMEGTEIVFSTEIPQKGMQNYEGQSQELYTAQDGSQFQIVTDVPNSDVLRYQDLTGATVVESGGTNSGESGVGEMADNDTQVIELISSGNGHSLDGQQVRYITISQ